MFRSTQKDFDYINFLNRLKYMGKINTYDANMELGKHYKYPPCCIKHFSKYIEMGIELVGLYMNTMYGIDGVGYVRCTKCRKLNYKEIKNAEMSKRS